MKDETTLSRRRDRLFIMAEILSIAKDQPMAKTQIMYRANLSFAQAQDYLSLMSELELLELTDLEPIRYKTTKKGLVYLRSYDQIRELLVSSRAKARQKPREIENLVRKKLQVMMGVSLPKRKLVIGYDRNKFPKLHEFDFVSDDGQIVGEIKSTTKISRNSYVSVLNDCFYLSRLQAKRKILVLTNKDFYRYFKAKSDGIIPNDIEVMHIPLD